VSWCAAPIVIALAFQRGAFSASDTLAVTDVFRWGLLQLPVYFAALVFAQLFAIQGRFRSMSTIAAVSFMVKVIGNFILIPRLGISGAQISTAFMYASAFVLYMMLILAWSPVKEGRDV
jgi:putative peptidoglycan lipid II flippase